MAHEVEVDDILIPQRRRRKKRLAPRKTNNTRKTVRGFTKFFMGLVLVGVVLCAILSFANIGGDVILEIAEKYFSENYKLSLKAERITGNPIKGYTLHNLEIADENKILSAEFLSGRLNLSALLHGKLRLAEISIRKISVDVDQLINNKFTSFDSFEEIPLDKISIVDSKFSSRYGVFKINSLVADLNKFDIVIDGNIDGIKFKGDIEMSGLTAINSSRIDFGGGKILATGGLAGNKIDFHASIEDLDLSEITTLSLIPLNSQDFNGKTNVNIEILGTTENPQVLGSVAYKGTKINGLLVERLSTNFDYTNDRLGFTDIQANILNIPIQGELAVENLFSKDIHVFIKLDGSEANLSGLDKVLDIPELKALSGKVSSFNANISGPVNSLNGIINFVAPRIAYDGRTFTNIKAQMKLNNSDTAQVDGKFNFEGANGYIQGNIASFLIYPRLNITTKIANLDIKRVENLIPDASDYKLAGNITATVSIKGPAVAPTVTGAISSPEFSGFGQKFVKPVINFTFADKTLTLHKPKGTLNGMPINLSGTIGPLPSYNPKLNIDATVVMLPEVLSAYLPDVDIYSYALKGTVNAGLKIQGTIYTPITKFLASSSKLEAMNMIKAREIELTTDINENLTKFEHALINATANEITVNDLTLTNINAILSKDEDKVTLESFNAKGGAGTITGAGVVSASDDIPLDFNFKFMNLALASLFSSLSVDVKGDLSGTLKISGANENPAITLNSNIPSLEVMGLNLTNVIANLSGKLTSIKLDKVRAEFGGSEIFVLGSMQLKPAVKFNIALNGNNIKLENLSDDINNTAAFNLTLSGNEKSIIGKGNISGLKWFTDKFAKDNTIEFNRGKIKLVPVSEDKVDRQSISIEIDLGGK